MPTHSLPVMFRCLRPLALTGLVALGAPAAAEPVDGPGASGKPVSPLGQGPGVHSPLSRFAPLKDRDGVVSWKLLSAVTTRVEAQTLRPVYPPAVRDLDGRDVVMQGFMMPLGAGAKQTHFLLSSVPPTCSYCVPAGAEGLVEVRARVPVAYTEQAIVLRGKMSVLANDPKGLYYRLANASPAR